MRQIYKTVSNQKDKTTVNILTIEQRAYLAGMIDADGSICKCKNREAYVCKVRVHNSSIILMNWLQKIIGAGNVSYLPPSTETKGYKHTLPRYTFNISAKVDVIEILNQIMPYLIIKKGKAEMIIHAVNNAKRPSKYKSRHKQNDDGG
jgi:hypothetical protein